MSSNFLQFNPSQVNQETDSAYAADATRSSGATTDSIFPSATANKAFYQWSTFVAAFGQMMANKGFSVSDAVLATLVSQLANVLTTADIRGSLENLAYSSGLALNASQYLGWQVVLTGPVTFTLTGAQVGDELTLVLIQDSTGGHTITWPANFEDALQPDSTANSVSVMSFKVRVDGTVWAARPVLSSSGINSTPIGQGSPAPGTFSSLLAPTMAPGDSSTHAATTAFVTLGLITGLQYSLSAGGTCGSTGATQGGYVAFPRWLTSGAQRLVIKWGSFGNLGNQTLTFDTTVPFAVTPIIVLGSQGATIEYSSVSPTSFYEGVTSGGLVGWNYFAIGYSSS